MDAGILRVWMQGDENAARFVEAYGEATRALDNLCDEEIPREERSEVCLRVMERFVGGMFCNPFYQAHCRELSAVMLQGVLEWDLSNELQRSEESTMQTFGYVRREASDGLVVMCAYLVGGRAWAAQVSREMITLFHGNQESVDDWVKELK